MNGLELIHFIRPGWLLALPLVLLLPWWWRRVRRPSGDWEKICDPHLLRWLSIEQAGRDHRSLRPWLVALALLITLLALAGPSWQQLPASTFSAHEAHVIALDLSASMLAEDLRPDRLTRARFVLADLLAQAREGQTGLVAFAGDAYVVSPLTNDTNTITNLLPALRPDVIPVSGSRADRALDLAADLLLRTGFSRGEILLVSDAADAADAAKARELRDRGIVTSVLAVGTLEGAPIPSGQGFVTDRGGNVVIARLAVRSLQEVAAAGGGNYSELGALAAVAGSPWSQRAGNEFSRREEALDQRWKDAGPYLVLLLLPLAAMAFRRGVLFLLPLGLLAGVLHTPALRADGWDDLWLRRDQQAERALNAQQPDRAAALAVDPALAAEAWYRSGKFDQAHSAWSGLGSADAHYNRGNALANLGEYEAAVQSFDQALQLDPAMEDARFNRQLVEQLLQQQQQQQQQQQDPQGDEGDPQGGESAQPSSAGEGSDPSNDESGAQSEPSGQENEQTGEPQAEPGDGQPQDGERTESALIESWSEEDAQAMEQWLRRIPDDPGGLLRRKFMGQQQRRGTPQDEAESW